MRTITSIGLALFCTLVAWCVATVPVIVPSAVKAGIFIYNITPTPSSTSTPSATSTPTP